MLARVALIEENLSEIVLTFSSLLAVTECFLLNGVFRWPLGNVLCEVDYFDVLVVLYESLRFRLPLMYLSCRGRMIYWT